MERNELYDIYTVWHVPFWQTAIFKGVVALVVGAILLVLLARGARWLIRITKRKSYWQQALDDLAAIKKNYGDEIQDSKKFYSEIIAVLKHYFSQRFGCDFAGKTDYESILFLQSIDFNKEHVQVLEELVMAGSMVKFANQQALQDQVEQDWKRCCLLIQATAPSQQKSDHSI